MARIAGITCPVCAQPDASVSRSKGNTLNVKCHRCDFSGYAQPGTRAARLIEQRMTPDDDASPAPAATTAAPPARKATGLLMDT